MSADTSSNLVVDTGAVAADAPTDARSPTANVEELKVKSLKLSFSLFFNFGSSRVLLQSQALRKQRMLPLKMRSLMRILQFLKCENCKICLNSIKM
jgi:hypothetical protein